MSLVLDEHRQYLSDTVRLEAFEAAIRATVQSGDVVVDLGSGTGILGFLACAAGASRVYAIEVGGMIQLAREIARANGFADRIVFVPGLSTQVELPERADVVVTDQIGRFGWDASGWEYLADAKRRFLRDRGRIVPESVTLVTAPVNAPVLMSQVDFWTGRPAGLDFRPARAWAVNTGYPATYSAEQLLGPPAPIMRVDLRQVGIEPFRARAVTPISHDGVLHGVAGWFKAELAPSVTLTNSPLAERRIRRQNEFFPIERPVDVRAGDDIAIDLRIDPLEIAMAWQVQILRSGVELASFRHSTWTGMLISAETLRRTRPDFTPRLTPRGLARRTVLELCDGTRALADVEREMYARHRDLFRSPAEACGFVAEVVTAYAD